MNVSNDSPAVDYVQYFTKQFPQDLAQMATLRDELAKRQGAMSAVEASLKDREAAKAELEKAKVQADDLVAEAKADNAAAKAKLAEVKDKEKALQYLRRMLALDPTNAAIQQNITVLEKSPANKPEPAPKPAPSN